MLEDLLRMDPLARMQAHDLIEKIDEVGVVDPLVAIVVEAFFEDRDEVAEARTEQLVLTSHYLDVIASSHTEKTHSDATVAV